MKTTSRTFRRTGFTLVEILVVVAIIGILAAILIPTLSMAIRYVREGGNSVELHDLERAMEQYKLDTGNAYPPDFSDPNLIAAHVKKISNKYNSAELNTFLTAIDSDNDLSNGLTSIITPDEALVFWLRFTRKSAEYPLTGDGTFETPVNVTETTRDFFAFDEDRLIDFDGDGFPSYVPKHGPKVPYVYFDRRTYDSAMFDPSIHSISDGAGWARPYAKTQTEWQSPNKFQIITAGYDGDYGRKATDGEYLDAVIVLNRKRKEFPSGKNFNSKDRDNMANFTEHRLDKELDQ